MNDRTLGYHHDRPIMRRQGLSPSGFSDWCFELGFLLAGFQILIESAISSKHQFVTSAQVFTAFA